MEAAKIPDSLWVYSGDEHVGTLYRTEPLEFDYSAFWLTKEEPFPSIQIFLWRREGRTPHTSTPSSKICFQKEISES